MQYCILNVPSVANLSVLDFLFCTFVQDIVNKLYTEYYPVCIMCNFV